MRNDSTIIDDLNVHFSETPPIENYDLVIDFVASDDLVPIKKRTIKIVLETYKTPFLLERWRSQKRKYGGGFSCWIEDIDKAFSVYFYNLFDDRMNDLITEDGKFLSAFALLDHLITGFSLPNEKILVHNPQGLLKNLWKDRSVDICTLNPQWAEAIKQSQAGIEVDW